MKKTVKGFIIGLITSTFLFGSVFAATNNVSISALLNGINIAVNGTSAAKTGENFTLANGSQVPYSINYKGTTYLPLRKVAELVGKDVSYVGASNTATISDKPGSEFACPMTLSYGISYDSNALPSIDLTAYNLSNKDIKDISLYVYCYDKDSKPVIDATGTNYMVGGFSDGFILKKASQEEFSYTLDGLKGTVFVGVEISDIEFTDGTKWTSY